MISLLIVWFIAQLVLWLSELSINWRTDLLNDWRFGSFFAKTPHRDVSYEKLLSKRLNDSYDTSKSEAQPKMYFDAAYPIRLDAFRSVQKNIIRKSL